MNEKEAQIEQREDLLNEREALLNERETRMRAKENKPDQALTTRFYFMSTYILYFNLLEFKRFELA